MKLTILSDIHLEFLSDYRHIISKLHHHKNHTDVCILAGDIGHCSSTIYYNFLKDMRKIFKHVIVIPGNHEYFVNQHMNEVDYMAKLVCQNNNCIFLNKSTILIDKVKFIGCTLWSDIKHSGNVPIIPNLSQKLFYKKTDLLQSLHNDHLSWLKNELEISTKRNQKIVVITHHCPSFQLRGEMYPLSARSKYYYTDLEYLIKKPIEVWACGHTHNQKELYINGTRLILNPIGYNKEQNSWNPFLNIRI